MSGLVDAADFSAVVADIYEASLSPAHWDTALTGLVSRFGTPRWDVAMLVWERVAPAGGRFVAASGVHAMARSAYCQMFAGRNEWSVRGHGLAIGSVVHSDQLIARSEFLQSAFFRDFLAMFDMQVALIGALDRQGSDHLGLCLPGPDNGSVERLQEAVALAIPHIQRAVRIARRLGQAELAAAQSTAALDHAPSPVLMLTEHFDLTYANRAGHQLIADLRLTDAAGRIRLGSMALHDDLRRLIDPDETANQGAHCRPLKLGDNDGNEIPAMAMRVNPDRIAGAVAPEGVARLMIVAANNPQINEEAIDHLRDWFGLTHAEARLAAVLGEGGTIEEYCQLRAVSTNAARFLLKGIFAKTGVSRQAELVQLIARSPLQWSSELPTTDLPNPID